LRASTTTSWRSTLATRSSTCQLTLMQAVSRIGTFGTMCFALTTCRTFNLAAYIKAAARDIKAYLASKSSKALVGYASVDGEEDFRGMVGFRAPRSPAPLMERCTILFPTVPIANYLTCGNETISVDLYGLSAWMATRIRTAIGCETYPSIPPEQTTTSGVDRQLMLLPVGKRSRTTFPRSKWPRTCLNMGKSVVHRMSETVDLTPVGETAASPTHLGCGRKFPCCTLNRSRTCSVAASLSVTSQRRMGMAW
jgi:hypothetical protein